MATAVVKGPLRILLQTSAGQYVMLGLGAYALFPEKFHKMLEYSPSLLRLVNGGNSDNNSRYSPPPIIIHTPSPTFYGGGSGSRTWTASIVYTAAGATACWAGYIAVVQLLPDSIGQFLPVTRTIFDKTSQSLGKGILRCKEVLEEKIGILSGHQEELGKKQDGTNKTVSHIKGELGEARMDLTMLQHSMDRCENSLENTAGMQQYTLRGVRILVRCVANMLPENQDSERELAQFIEEEQRQQKLLNASLQNNPDKSGNVPGSPDDIPMASAITPAQATAMYTPSLRRSGSRRQSDMSTAKKNLQMEEADQDEGAFSDIRALLGH
jgi:hypothetical protein